MDARQQPVVCAAGHRVAKSHAARLAFIAAVAAVVIAGSATAFAAGYRTQYFIVTASTPEYAKEVAEAAERLRKELAIEWLGRELPPWRDSCPIEVLNDKGAGGVTQFYFDRGQPYGWSMRIQGTRERVLDSVLPHEITHMVFATHFGCPLPRWADEGACTTTEHISERQKQERLLNSFLQTNRGIPFNAMFAMTEYPSDVLPLYAQGYSLSRFLISLEGRQRFIQFVGEGLADRRWAAAVKRSYGFADLSDLQTQWNRWVAQGGHPEFASRFRGGATATSQVATTNAAVRSRGTTSPPQPPAKLAAASSIARVVPAAPLVPVTYSNSDIPRQQLAISVAGPTSAGVAETRVPALNAADSGADEPGQGVRVGFTPLSPIPAVPATRPNTDASVAADDPYATTRNAYLREHPEEASRDPQRSKPVRQIAGNASPKVLLEWSRQPTPTTWR